MGATMEMVATVEASSSRHRARLSDRVESSLQCPRCRTALDQSLSCGSCDFHIETRSGVFVCQPQPAGHAFNDYSLECGVSQYTTEELVEHEYYLRFLGNISHGVVLECGGGDGNASALWARRNPGAELVVVDMDGFALRKAVKRGLPNLAALKTPVLSLPFADGSIDVVFTTFMVEHLYDWELSRFYMEARRVLKTGGTLIVQSDAPFFDKFIHPVLRLLKCKGWRTSGFLDRWRTDVRSVHHHNLKTPEVQAQIVARHGLFVQGIEVPLLFSNRIAAAAAYETAGGILPSWLLNRFLGTSYTVIASKP